MFCRRLPSLFLGVQVDGDNEPVEPKHLGEDENEDHSDEEPWLLRCASYTSVTDDSDGITCRQPRETHRKPCTQMHKTPAKFNVR